MGDVRTFDEWWDAPPEPTKGHVGRNLREAFEDCWNAAFEAGRRQNAQPVVTPDVSGLKDLYGKP